MFVESYRLWSTLLLVEKQGNYRHLIVNYDYLELNNYFQNLQNLGLITREHNEFYLTDRGKYKKKKLEKELQLTGLEKYIVPISEVIIERMDKNELYY